MEIYKFFVFLFLFLSSCESPVSSEKVNIPNEAKAGEDQITYVGSYLILDPSKSIVNGEHIDLINWLNSPDNPEDVFTFHSSSLKDVSVVGFNKEGTYKFILQISCKSGNVYSDSLTVTVKPRQNSRLIEDMNLEIFIRFRLKFSEGELTADKLLLVDSLSTAEMGLKNKITSIKGIEYCKNLTYLLLGLESISDLKPLENLMKIEVLDVNQNYTISDITPVYNLLNLKKLVLYDNPITDISGIGRLSKLEYLDLNFTPVENIDAISTLVNIEILSLGGYGGNKSVKFTNIKPLSNLKKLKQLTLAARGLTSIKSLENLTELDFLDLSYNNLTEISSVCRMKKLVRFLIRRNSVSDISGIKNLESLDYLDAADNQIKDVSELQYLPNIHLIGLGGNKIEDILPIVNNQSLNTGVYLYLNNNPLNSQSINEYLPILAKRGVKVFR